jgi:esterase/lipase
LNNLEDNNNHTKDNKMRALSYYASLLFAFTTTIVSAQSLDCITINDDVSHIEKLAKDGGYRFLASDEKRLTFNYQENKSYTEYLAFASAQINSENPKATLKCPIETTVTKAQGKKREALVVADLVSPFELKADNDEKAILLIHGLTDSPYLLHDLASFYYQQGFNVRSLLLPGHGTAPEALTEVDYEEWQAATAFAISSILSDYKQVYLGGFSTGGALILDNILTTKEIPNHLKGVMLWAPASKAKSSVAWAAQVVDWIPFVDYAHKGADIDFAKYETFPLNAGAQVHALMNQLTDKLNEAKSIPDVPLLTITTEVDSTIDTDSTIELLTKWHNAPNRKTRTQDTLFYFGDNASLSSLPNTFKRIFPTCKNGEFCKNIINVAHTAVTNAPTNPHYGWQGSYRNCETSFGTSFYQTCKTTEKPVLGETTGDNLTKYPSLQRLTFNPSFEQMSDVVKDFINKTQ